MRVLRLHPDRGVRLHDEPRPEPGPGEALVRVTAVGLCGSDRHWLLEGGIGETTVTRPLVLGHEFGGVAETGRYRGRRVAVDPAVPCWSCELCATGRENLCIDIRFAGYGRTDGALRELVAWPEQSMRPLSDDLDESVEALVEPLAIAVHALDLGGSVTGARVAVLGAGPIGLLVVALARRAGAAEILATDPLPHRRDAALQFGATDAAPAADESRHAAFDVVFEAAGEQAAVDDAIDLAAPGATVILVGIPAEERTSFRAAVARRKGLVLKLTRRSTAATFSRAVQLAEERALDLPGLVTRRVPLHDFEDGIRALVERAGLKVVIEPGAGSRAAAAITTIRVAEVRAG
jgi:L-iditol 2-dehydrogenase